MRVRSKNNNPWRACLMLLSIALLAGLGGCSRDTDAPADAQTAAVGDARPALDDTPAISEVLLPTFAETWAEWRGDLDGMIERRMIRVVTPFGGYMYYFDDGRPRGATWELANLLERTLNEELGRRNVRVFVVVTPLARNRLIPALLEGHADIIAADLTMTDMRSEAVAFTRPLLTDINEVIVTGPTATTIAAIDDLAGQPIHVRQSSSYYEHLVRLSAEMRLQGLAPPEIVPVDELLESEDLLDMLNNGMFSMTVMDDYKAQLWADVFDDIDVRDDLVINEGGSIAWVVRKDSPQLLATLNDFLRRYGRGTLVGNDTYNRYLDDASELRCSDSLATNERLDRLADLFQKYAAEYRFNWLQLAAQGLQESGLRQSRISSAGAVGIMQIKPSTAADANVGIDDVTTPENNIHAGTRYLRFLTDRYFSDTAINDLNRWLLSLAAYNAGPARVIALRREAAENGYDPNVWFDNVEIIAARRIGSETVTYVSNIFKYFTGYQMAAATVLESQRRFGEYLGECTPEPVAAR